MANATTPFGLRPVRHLGGVPWNGQVRRVYFDDSDATATYIGDPVVHDTTLAQMDTTAKSVTVIKGNLTTANTQLGILVGFEPYRTDLTKVYRVASTERWAFATYPDPSIIYQIRGDGSGTGHKMFPGANGVGVDAGGSTTTGLSGFAMDESTPTTTQAHCLHILNLASFEDNELDDYAIWEVMLNTAWNATGNILGVVAA